MPPQAELKLKSLSLKRLRHFYVPPSGASFHTGFRQHAGGVVRRGPLADEELTGVLVALVLAIVLITMLGERIW